MTEKDIILIIDDNEINRMAFISSLGDNYEYIEAENGSDAIEILETTPNISLILLDLFMPEMDGLTFLKIIKDTNSYNNIPIIICTVDDREEIEEKALRLGADDYIVNPYRPAAVKQKIKNTISRIKNAQALSQARLTNYQLVAAKKELVETNARLKSIIDNMPGAVATYEIIKGEPNLTYISDGCERIFGYTADETLKWQENNILKDVHPDDFSELHDSMHDAIKNRLSSSYTYRQKCKNGIYKWISLSVSPVFLNAKLFFYGVITDIDRNVKNDNELRIHDDFSKLLIDDASTSIFHLDLITNQIELYVQSESGKWEKKIIDNFDYNGSSLIKKEYLDMVRQENMKALKKEKVTSYEYEANFFEKGYKRYRIDFKSYKGANGKISKILGKIQPVD